MEPGTATGSVSEGEAAIDCIPRSRFGLRSQPPILVTELDRGSSVEITVNGQTRLIGEGATIAELLDECDLTTKYVAVEVNRELVPKNLHAEHRLAAGDELEIVTLVGGG